MNPLGGTNICFRPITIVKCKNELITLRNTNKDKHILFYFLFLRVNTNDHFGSDEKSNDHADVAYL